MSPVLRCMQALRKMIAAKELSFGGWQALAHSSITEIMVKAGFHWLVVDMEHSVIGLESLQPLLQTAQSLGCPVLVRVPSNDKVVIKRVMDAGASGIIVPMVNSVEDAKNAVSAVHYPPLGERGTGLARAQEYGAGFESYMECNNQNAVLFVQIEHRDAVEDIEAILNVERVDGFFIGPYDLSASYGIAGKLQHKQVLEAEQEVLKAARLTHKLCGIHIVHPTTGLVKEKIAMGFQFIALGTDFLYLGDACRAFLKEIRSHFFPSGVCSQPSC